MKFISVKIEYLICKECNCTTLHEIRIDCDNDKIESVKCMKCKYNKDQEAYEALQQVWDAGKRFALGIE